jgi:hypothetical protein
LSLSEIVDGVNLHPQKSCLTVKAGVGSSIMHVDINALYPVSVRYPHAPSCDVDSWDPHFFPFDLIHDAIVADTELPVASQRLAKRCAVSVWSASQSRRHGSSNPDVEVLQKRHVLPLLLAGQCEC